jgi:hypothetical protein
MDLDGIKKLIRLNKIGQALNEISKLTKKLSSELEASTIILQSRLVEYEQNAINGAANDTDFNKIKTAILMHLNTIIDQTDGKGEILTETNETLLIENSYAFIDRVSFRNIIKDALKSDVGKLIFINSTPKTGMSYLEKYLEHLEQKNKLIQFIPINIPSLLENPNPGKGVSLAKYISLYSKAEIVFNDTDDDQYKFAQLITKLKESFEKRSTIPLFFLHDFHRLSIITPDLLNLIYNIAITIRRKFPKSIFIIAGLNCELMSNWHSELEQFFPIYPLESISEENIIECLSSIFDRYEEKISILINGQITKNKYIEEMIFRLIPEKHKIDLVDVGDKIRKHLIELKKI